MAMLITTLGDLEKKMTEEAWHLYCADNGIDPQKYNPEEETAVDKLDLDRYGLADERRKIEADVKKILGQ